jgi:hypothetical protein
MDDFIINDSNIDNVLPVSSGGLGDYDEDERIDETLKQEQEEKHMIRSSKGPLLDNVIQWLDDTSLELDQNSTVRKIMHGHELGKYTSGPALEVASLAAEVARRLFEDKRNELINLKNIHISDSER